MKSPSLVILLGSVLTSTLHAVVVNADFSRDIVNGPNPPTANPAPVLYVGTGPAPDSGTVWNNVTIPLAVTGEAGPNTIDNPFTFSNLTSSSGSATTIDIQLTSGFFRSFNSGTGAATNTVADLQNDRVFARNGETATVTVTGLNNAFSYDFYFITGAGLNTTYTIGATSANATGTEVGGWTEGQEFARIQGIVPTGDTVVFTLTDGITPFNGFGSISGIQIVEVVPEPSVALLSSFALLALTRRRRTP